MKEFSPLEEFELKISRLWLVVLLTLIGGSLAWIFQKSHAPLYEAKAVLVVNIDLPRTEPLSPFEIDHAVGGAGSIMISSQVMEKLLSKAKLLLITPKDLIFGRDLFRERKQESWELRVRNRDPQIAADLANMWAETAYQALIEARQHALHAEVLHNYLAALADCPPAPELESAPPPLCVGESQGEIQHNLSAVEAELQNELAESHGLLPSLLIDFSQRAEAPTTPIAYRANLVMLAGALIGFICGVGLVSSRLLPG